MGTEYCDSGSSMWVWQKILSSFQCFNTKAAGCVQIKGLMLTTISSTTQGLEIQRLVETA